jgi:hypothetical protein
MTLGHKYKSTYQYHRLRVAQFLQWRFFALHFLSWLAAAIVIGGYFIQIDWPPNIFVK